MSLVLVPLLAAGLAFGGTALRERGLRTRATIRRNAEIASSLRTGLATPTEILYATQTFLELERSAPLTEAEFRAFCAPARARHPELAGLEWFPVVSGAPHERRRRT